MKLSVDKMLKPMTNLNTRITYRIPALKKSVAIMVAIGFLVGSVFSGSQLIKEAQAGMPDVIRIEVGQKEKNYTQTDLQYRIWMLERAVAQLQARVFELEGTANKKDDKSNWTTCYIKTPFNGTFTATEQTETAARAKAMELCSKSAGDTFYCGEDRTKCGK